jgi:hypothetical protein
MQARRYLATEGANVFRIGPYERKACYGDGGNLRIHGYNNWTIVSLKSFRFYWTNNFVAACDSCAMRLAVSPRYRHVNRSWLYSVRIHCRMVCKIWHRNLRSCRELVFVTVSGG